jgi:uncharacterized membrane protein
MLHRLRTFFKHRWMDESDTRRIVGAATLDRLTRLVASSEARHTGEIRIFIEASLPTSYLWRHLVRGTPIPVLAQQRARMMFSKLGVWDTADNNGVLIYLLLAERRIELVADRGIDAVVGPAEWSGMVGCMGVAFAAGQFEAGLTQAVEAVSTPLLLHFATVPGTGNRNELPDEPALG